MTLAMAVHAGLDLRAGALVPVLGFIGLLWLAAPARAETPLKVPVPIPVRAADRLAEAFKSNVGDRVFFAAGSASLGGRARVALEAQAVWLLQHASVAVVIEGYADDPGGDDANQALAQARAETVRDKLAQLGVPEQRLAVAAFGRTGQVVTCGDAACAAANRRVVLRIAGPQAAVDPAPESLAPGIRPQLRRLF